MLGNQAKGIRITSQTLLGVEKSKFPLPFGNCFSMETEDGKEYRIVNFLLENLKEAIKRGINLPVVLVLLDQKTAIINDARIPDDWYRPQWCEACCPESLLPVQQQLRHMREEVQGVRKHSNNMIVVCPGKRPEL